MIHLIFKTVLFWRFNNFSSIVFKAAVLGCGAGLFTSIWAETTIALAAGAIIATIAFIIYGRKFILEQQKILKHLNGDKEKLKRLKAKIGGGIKGAIAMEQIRQEIEIDDDDFDEEDHDLSQMSKKELKLQFPQLTKTVDSSINTLEQEYGITIHDKESRIKEVYDEFANYEEANELEVISTLLPESKIHFYYDGWINDEDHAGLVEIFSEATNGSFNISQCNSFYSEEEDKWVVEFMLDGEKHSWKFEQFSGGYISDRFLDKLSSLVESYTGYKIHKIDDEDAYYAVCLPSKSSPIIKSK